MHNFKLNLNFELKCMARNGIKCNALCESDTDFILTVWLSRTNSQSPFNLSSCSSPHQCLYRTWKGQTCQHVSPRSHYPFHTWLSMMLLSPWELHWFH